MRLLRQLRAVLWSLIGIRRRADAMRDVEGAHPAILVALGIAVVAIIMLGIATLVHFVARRDDVANEGTRATTPSAAPRRSSATQGPVVVEDTMAARVRACTGCHGSSTTPTRDGFSPRLAGKPAGYLYNQLASFRDGRRTYAPMVYLVQYMSDDYLHEIAGYFAGLDLPYAPPEALTLTPAADERARTLVEHGDPARDLPACSTCHGATLGGVAPAIPGLLGLPRHYIAAQLGAWRSGRLRSVAPDCMGEVARRLAPEDVATISAWLAAQPVAPGMRPEKAATRRLPLTCGSVEAAAHAEGTGEVNRAQAATMTAPTPSAAAAGNTPAARGRYLVAAGDCVACHTSIGGAPFAGGRGIDTPFGTVYSTNLTPEPQTGIGTWSADDFWRALHEGRGKDGRLLYPAFPYPNFTRVSREDSDAMFAYLRTLPAVTRQNRAHGLRFPYRTQVALAAWRALYFRPGTYVPDASKGDEWNRGAYLVQGLGHCDACHGNRNFLGAVQGQLDLGGGLIPMQNWYAPPLVSATHAGVASWSADEVSALLRTGVSKRATAMGPMAEVVFRSTQHLSVADANAIAMYLASLRGDAAPAVQQPGVDARQFEAGRTLYAEHCAECHGADGEGAFPAYPPLARNPGVAEASAASAAKAVLYGGYAPVTAGNPRPYGMPPYFNTLSDADIAAILTYVRASWGNAAAPVSALDVERVR